MHSAHITKAPPRTRHLISQVAWFNRLRFIAVGGMVTCTLLGRAIGLLDSVTPILVLAGITLALNLLYTWLFAIPLSASYRSVRRHVDLQIGLDLLILTAVLRFSGGSTNPLAIVFLFHAFIAAQVVSIRAGLAVALASLGLVAGLGVLELSGWLSPVPDGLRLSDLRVGGVVVLLSWLVTLGTTLLMSVYFVATVLRQVRSRDEELRRLNLQLGQSEKLASVGTLAAGVAHEINNPVGVIRTRAQILRYRIQDEEDAASLLAELDTIEKHTDRIGAITQGLLTFSKEAPFELVSLDLNRVVKEAAELVRVPFKEREVTLLTRMSPRPVWVDGSENHLLQVLVNILLNARDASPPGGEVVVSVDADEGIATLGIRDEGEGIPPENLKKIFDPFFTTKDVDRGTGLGLAITHGIVEKHEGTIQVQSTMGGGTTFRVHLPLHD
jgi:signal transduction histidine kinase